MTSIKTLRTEPTRGTFGLGSVLRQRKFDGQVSISTKDFLSVRTEDQQRRQHLVYIKFQSTIILFRIKIIIIIQNI